MKFYAHLLDMKRVAHLFVIRIQQLNLIRIHADPNPQLTASKSISTYSHMEEGGEVNKREG
jgi:hypothetical protein